MSKIITSEAFAQALAQAGIIDEPGNVRRIVIDAQPRHALIIHVEYLGDERILDVIPSITGAEVRTQRDQAPRPDPA